MFHLLAKRRSILPMCVLPVLLQFGSAIPSTEKGHKICAATLQRSLDVSAATSDRVISLAGQWVIRLDPQRRGLNEKWFAGGLPAGPAEQYRVASLPGSTDQHKLGTPNRKKPTLDGLYRLISYEGPAWYQREIHVPAAWQGRRVSLFIERTHGESRVWLDDHAIGTRNTLIAPHVYDLGALLSPGKHRLTICVDNTHKLNLGAFPSVLYEGTQTNWNGLIGRLELRAVDAVAIDNVQVYPDVDRRLARVRVTIVNTASEPIHGKLTLQVVEQQTGKIAAVSTADFAAPSSKTVVDAELSLGRDVRLWDEFSPALYNLTVSLAADRPSQSFDRQSVTFGMRKFSVAGTQFAMNGRRLMLRGTLECGIFPLTGYPPTDLASWQRIYRTIKSYGLNYMRFHSWCPPDAAFEAADIEGVMLQVEGPLANAEDVGKNAVRDDFLEQELLRIVRTYGNRPSFCQMTLGNEYGGPDALLSGWVTMLKKQDPRHLYASPSSGQDTANRHYTEACDRKDFGSIRGIRGPQTDDDFRAAIDHEGRPIVAHEIGQWTFYPNFDEIAKYTGVLAAKNFELVRNDLKAKHLLDLAPDWFKRPAGMRCCFTKKKSK